ncbi:MAG: aminotransferase class V-fold PLP-dependent enzyme [Candidatus Aminicenantes bacterium]|nr:aminotransferase class V-fold PLP-dependent enzyme [Candidatus Aminicenantes bacterium]
MRWNLEHDLDLIRKEFPILERCVYLISNSLGAVPGRALENLQKFYQIWAEEGVSAWEKEWWGLSRKVGNQVAYFLGAGEDEVTMIPNATHCHWVALSTKFLAQDERRKKIVMTDHDFPSMIYAVSRISDFRGWKVEIVRSNGNPGIDVEDILKRIDEETLFVATSHVYYKSAYIQNIKQISSRAREVGALTLIDGYHAPGIIPVDVKQLDADFYIGGCLKWLCGGPGNAFLYVRPELSENLDPQLTGWFAHREPFLFAQDMEYARGGQKFMSGTPPVPCLYTARAGLEILKKIGIPEVRDKSLSLTELIIKKAKERGYRIFTPEENNLRGGSVSISLPHAFPLKQALDKRRVKVDFRKGDDKEPDVIRVGPHFYNNDEEIDILFKEIDAIYASGEFKKFPTGIKHVT